MIKPVINDLMDLTVFMGQEYNDAVLQGIIMNQKALAYKLDAVISILNGSDDLRTAVNVSRYRSKDGV